MEMAPQVGLEPTTLRLTGAAARLYAIACRVLLPLKSQSFVGSYDRVDCWVYWRYLSPQKSPHHAHAPLVLAQGESSNPRPFAAERWSWGDSERGGCFDASYGLPAEDTFVCRGGNEGLRNGGSAHRKLRGARIPEQHGGTQRFTMTPLTVNGSVPLLKVASRLPVARSNL